MTLRGAALATKQSHARQGGTASRKSLAVTFKAVYDDFNNCKGQEIHLKEAEIHNLQKLNSQVRFSRRKKDEPQRQEGR
jgi:hypothetical protein